MIRISGRADGAELRDALYGLHRWRSLARRIPELPVTPTGSLTLLENQDQPDVAHEYVHRFGDRIQLEVIDNRRIGELAPEVKLATVGALWCGDDTCIDPVGTVPVLMDYLEFAEGVEVRRGTKALAVEPAGGHLVVNTSRGRIPADQVFVCIGHRTALTSSLDDRTQLEQVELSWVEADLGVTPSLPITDSSAFDLYPGYRAITGVRDPDPDHEWIAATHPNGRTMIGIARRREGREPDTTTSDLVDRAEEVFGSSRPVVRADWSAPITRPKTGLFHSSTPIPGVTVLSAFGQMGNTLAAAIALQVVDDAGR